MSHIGKALVILACVTAQATFAQQDSVRVSNVPIHVRSLVVHIISEGEFRQDDGAGIVVGGDDEFTYIVTARHVVEEDSGQVFGRILVKFAESKDSAIATVTRVSDDEIDLAVIQIDAQTARDVGIDANVNWLGASNQLRQGDEVSPVGCPQTVCWEAPLPADQVLSTNRLGIAFQSTFVKPGSSGGGIFNAWWEVVGIVTDEQPPRAEALPMDFVVSRLAEWQIPVTLKRASIPRRGYTRTIGVTWLIPTRNGGSTGRVPSGRATLTLALRSGFDINVSGVRIAPKKVGNNCPPPVSGADSVSKQIAFRDRVACEAVINAVMGGLGYRLAFSRFTARPFAELGMGRSRGRYDIGGVYDANTNTYLPSLRAVEQTGFGFGAGLTLDAVVIPRIILQGLVGIWSFNDPFEGAALPPEFKPDMPTVYLGIGARFAL